MSVSVIMLLLILVSYLVSLVATIVWMKRPNDKWDDLLAKNYMESNQKSKSSGDMSSID